MSTLTTTLTGTSPAAPGNSTLGPFNHDPSYYDGIIIYASLLGATGGTLDIYCQTTFDGGSTWVDFGHFPQLAAAAPAIKYIQQTSNDMGMSVPVVTGDAAMAVNVFVPGALGKQIRVKMVAGAATSAGAAQSLTFSQYRRDPA